MSVKKLILDGEGVSLDFKQTITNCSKIARTMVSFANNQGGKLLVGVANDGKILGVKTEEEEKYMLLKAAQRYCKPSLELIIDEINIDHKIILQVEIKESDLKPHYALSEDNKWIVYIRIKDKSVQADQLIIDVLEQPLDTYKLLPTLEKQKLLSYLELNNKATLSQCSTALNLPNSRTQDILVSLLLSGAIELHASSKDEYFTTL